MSIEEVIGVLTEEQSWNSIWKPLLFVCLEFLIALTVLPKLLNSFARYLKKRYDIARRFHLRSLRSAALLIAFLIMLHIHLGHHLDGIREFYIAWKLSLTLAVIWAVRQITTAFFKAVLLKFEPKPGVNLKERKVKTQLLYLETVTITFVYVFGAVAILFNFQGWFAVAKSLLASAGIAGLVIGFAAQKFLANLIAGFQIAITQPIRVDDVVIIEKEWGWIEEITLTYVVVKIWDLRRLVIPISQFTDQPFQNWTRSASELLGAVILHLDYSVKVDDIRLKLEEILQTEEKWNKKISVVQVIESDLHAMQVRILVSADSSPEAWDLRCSVREKLISYLQNYPNAFPKIKLDGNRQTLMPDSQTQFINK